MGEPHADDCFHPNQRVTSGACSLWDPSGSQPWSAVYGKHFWHLPLPEGRDLDDLELPSGFRVRCLEPLASYALHDLDPDDQEVEIDLAYDERHEVLAGRPPGLRLLDPEVALPRTSALRCPDALCVATT